MIDFFIVDSATAIRLAGQFTPSEFRRIGESHFRKMRDFLTMGGGRGNFVLRAAQKGNLFLGARSLDARSPFQVAE